MTRGFAASNYRMSIKHRLSISSLTIVGQAEGDGCIFLGGERIPNRRAINRKRGESTMSKPSVTEERLQRLIDEDDIQTCDVPIRSMCEP